MTDNQDSSQTDEDQNAGDENHQLNIVKKHKCPSCDKHFTHQNSVSRHISAVHEGKKPYVCEICGASFSQNKNLAVHVAAKHEGKKPFQCELCGVSYREKRCLQRHSLRMHKKTLNELRIPNEENKKLENNMYLVKIDDGDQISALPEAAQKSIRFWNFLSPPTPPQMSIAC